MSLTRYWSDDRGGWAYAESIFDGRELPRPQDDERFWMQREAVLGTGSLRIGEYLSQDDMKRAKNVPKVDVQRPAKRRWTLQRCVCGRVRPEAAAYCKTCETNGRGTGSRRRIAARAQREAA